MKKPLRSPSGRPSSTTRSSKTAKSRPKPKKRKTRSTDRSRARIAFLGLGSNRGDRRAHIERAIAQIAERAPILAASSYYETEPVGFSEQAPFYNAVVAISWASSPARLLSAVKRIEKAVGRTPSFRNGPREIDVDVLDLGGVFRPSADPILPHPRMASRRFVLAPLSEIAPGWRHPETRATAQELLRALPARPSARRLSSRPRGWPARLPGSSSPR